MKSDVLYVVDIAERIRRVHASAAEGRDTFFASYEKQDAILHNLQLLGESVRRVSEELKQRYPEVPWREIAAFRNVVVHEYMRVAAVALTVDETTRRVRSRGGRSSLVGRLPDLRCMTRHRLVSLAPRH